MTDDVTLYTEQLRLKNGWKSLDITRKDPGNTFLGVLFLKHIFRSEIEYYQNGVQYFVLTFYQIFRSTDEKGKI